MLSGRSNASFNNFSQTQKWNQYGYVNDYGDDQPKVKNFPFKSKSIPSEKI